MPRGRVWSETIEHKRKGRKPRVTRYWCFRIHAWNGVVLQDNGFATWDAAFDEASRLTGAVALIEKRGHRLESWRDLVDKAARR